MPKRKAILLLLVLAACVATRLPLVFFPEMPLTGDECVVALMGKHLTEGHDISLYFYGQHYGLSLVEAAAAAVLYPFLGVTAVAVKLGMLGLLLMACRFLYAALARIAGATAAVFGVLMFLALPPWTLWSIQARGGYITALLGACVVLTGVATLEQRPSRWGWIGVAIAAAVTLLAKSSWLPALLPVLLLVPLRTRNLRLGVLLLVGIALLCSAGHLAGTLLTRDYWQQPAVGIQQIAQSLRLLPGLLTYHFTTDLFSARPENLFYQACGRIWLVGLPFGLGIQVWRLATRHVHPWSHALCLATLGSLAALLVVPLLPRYLLSVSFFLVVWLSVDVAALPHRRLSAALATLLIVLGFAGVAVDRYTAGDQAGEAEIHELIDLLEGEGIHRVYSTEALLQWMVMFYSNESILCRWYDVDDRIPAIPRAVDRALHAGEPVAIIGMMGNLGGLAAPDAGIDLYSFPDLPFFIAPHPTPEVLERNGFRITPRTTESPR